MSKKSKFLPYFGCRVHSFCLGFTKMAPKACPCIALSKNVPTFTCFPKTKGQKAPLAVFMLIPALFSARQCAPKNYFSSKNLYFS